MSAFSWLFSIGHHFGLTSIPQVMHTLSPLGGMTEAVSDGLSIEEALREPDPFPRVVVVDARRLVLTGGTTTGDFVAMAIKLAFRTVPVRVKSACLKFCTYSCNALGAISSLPTFSDWLTTSCIRWTTVRVGICSLHQIAADMAPVSPLMETMLNWSRRDPLTGVTSKPRR